VVTQDMEEMGEGMVGTEVADTKVRTAIRSLGCRLGAQTGYPRKSIVGRSTRWCERPCGRRTQSLERADAIKNPSAAPINMPEAKAVLGYPVM